MRYADINKRFTDIVAEYIGRGYVINTGTMTGSQGEVAKVDLTNGTEIIRVLLDKCTLYYNSHNGYRIFVGKCNNKELVNVEEGIGRTVWSDDLTEISSERFFYADYDAEYGENSRWFVTEEEKKSILLLRTKRYFDRTIRDSDLPTNASEIAYKYVKRRMRLARARKADIRIYKRNDGRYCVTYRDHSWILK